MRATESKPAKLLTPEHGIFIRVLLRVQPLEVLNWRLVVRELIGRVL